MLTGFFFWGFKGPKFPPAARNIAGSPNFANKYALTALERLKALRAEGLGFARIAAD